MASANRVVMVTRHPKIKSHATKLVPRLKFQWLNALHSKDTRKLWAQECQLVPQINVFQDRFWKLTELVKLARSIRDHLLIMMPTRQLQRSVPLIIVLMDKSSTQMELASTAQLDGLFQAVESTASTLKTKNKTWFLPWSRSLPCILKLHMTANS